MVTRNDITVDWNVSPRIVTVASPSTELLMQDLVDTLRTIEDDFRGMSEISLLDAFGKQGLFGTVAVGITVALQDAQIEFQARTTPAETGTATTGSVTQLIDSTASFVVAGVKRGSIVVNFTDQSVSDVLRVVNATTLDLRGLTGGTDNDFDIGDSYKVWNIPLVNALGGNLTAVDDLGAQINPLLSTFATQVSRALSADSTIVDDSRIADLHKMRGLDAANPWKITDTSHVAGSVSQTISDDGTTTTVQRT